MVGQHQCTRKKDYGLLKNYLSNSLLHVVSKVFERVICKSLFNYFLDNKF